MADIRGAIKKAIALSQPEKLRDSTFMADILDDLLPGEDSGKLLVLRGYSKELGALLYEAYFGRAKKRSYGAAQGYLVNTAGFSEAECAEFLSYFDAAFGRTGKKQDPVPAPPKKTPQSQKQASPKPAPGKESGPEPTPQPKQTPQPEPTPAPKPTSDPAPTPAPQPAGTRTSAAAKNAPKKEGASPVQKVAVLVLLAAFVFLAITAGTRISRASEYSKAVENYQRRPSSSYSAMKKLNDKGFRNSSDWTRFLRWESAIDNLSGGDGSWIAEEYVNPADLRAEDADKMDILAMANLMKARSGYQPDEDVLPDSSVAYYTKAWQLLRDNASSKIPDREKLISECLYHLVLHYRGSGDSAKAQELSDQITDEGFRMLASEDSTETHARIVSAIPSDGTDPVFSGEPFDPSEFVVSSSGFIGKHTAEKAFDMDDSTDWQECADGNGIGEWICVEFPESRVVSGVAIAAGSGANKRELNTTPTQLAIYFDEGVQVDVNIPYQETPDYACFVLSEPQVTKSVLFEIMDVHPGTEYEDAVIRDIVLF